MHGQPHIRFKVVCLVGLGGFLRGAFVVQCMEIIRGILRYVPPITNDQRAAEGFGGDIMNVLPCKRGG